MTKTNIACEPHGAESPTAPRDPLKESLEEFAGQADELIDRLLSEDVVEMAPAEDVQAPVIPDAEEIEARIDSIFTPAPAPGAGVPRRFWLAAVVLAVVVIGAGLGLHFFGGDATADRDAFAASAAPSRAVTPGVTSVSEPSVAAVVAAVDTSAGAELAGPPVPRDEAPAVVSRPAVGEPVAAAATVATVDGAEDTSVLPAVGVAATPPQAEQAYIVRPGDTLSSIAAAELGDERRYLEIYEMNREVVVDPNRILAGTLLRLSRQPGR